MKLGIIREGKNPPDKRVPLTPDQVKRLQTQYPQLELFVQPSPIRAFKDQEYQDLGIELREDLSNCDLLLGVKEVPVEMLIPNKTYLFFSHTYKKQAYNRELLRAILDKKIRLIDYEMLKDPGGKRLLGFGRYAGIVGAYNGFRAYGELTGNYQLKPAHQCFDRRELESELVKVKLPPNFRIALTGAGRVAGGAMEILSALKITHVFPKEFIREDFNKEQVFTQLGVNHYFKRSDGQSFTRQDFYRDASGYERNFLKYAEHADMYIAAHYWAEGSPLIFSREDARDPRFNIQLVADISCDIDGPVASTLRPSTIAEPFYAYDPQTESEVPFGQEGSIAVSAVDNLPGELPRDASEDFGNELIKNVLPHFFNDDKDAVLERASETDLQGQLGPHFSYLADYVS
jgi:alanine dehydrogenase